LKASPELLEEVLVELRERRKELTSTHRFREAKKYTRAIAHVLATHVKLSKVATQKSALEELLTESKEVQEERKSFDKETQRLIDELKALQEEKREQLLETFRIQKIRHNREWGSGRRKRLYSRISVGMSILHRQRALMAMQYRLEEAESVSRLIGERTASEQIERGKARQMAYDVSVSKLKAKQSGELSLFDEQAAVQIEQLKQQREMQRRAIEHKQKKIDARMEAVKDMERVWNAKQLERLGHITAGIAFGTRLPSARIKREELEKLEYGSLALPALQLDTEKPSQGFRRFARHAVS
jgi:gamma-glutamylcyclotransferase (GGCT)/AIG2-like uncharacterized protein YtfP